MPTGQKLLDSLAETWDFFFSDVLPTLQAIFYPVQVNGPCGHGMPGAPATTHLSTLSPARGWPHPWTPHLLSHLQFGTEDSPPYPQALSSPGQHIVGPSPHTVGACYVTVTLSLPGEAGWGLSSGQGHPGRRVG